MLTPGYIPPGRTVANATSEYLKGFPLDTSVYPDAICNDGSPASIYYRPGTDTGNWLIELEGGGGCSTPDECARRYCAQDSQGNSSNFGAALMGSGLYPHTPLGRGIQSSNSSYPDSMNPFLAYNKVLIHYCSSDAWTGMSASATGTATSDPTGGSPYVAADGSVSFATPFNGDAILFDALRALRRDGMTLPTYNLGGVSWTMPDLDQATGFVVIAGGSAGGVGVTFQLDRIVDYLNGKHVKGTSATYVGLIDSAFPPYVQGLSYDLTQPCVTDGACTYADFIESNKPYFDTRSDESCTNMHSTSDAYLCDDHTHVIHHHTTSPFFIRESQQNWLANRTYYQAGLARLSTPTVKMTSNDFQVLTAAQGEQALSWGTTAEESHTVGAFIPNCTIHDPLHDPWAMFTTTLSIPPIGYEWQNVFNSWLSGGSSPTILVDATGTNSSCVDDPPAFTPPP
jgi:hypothetical protein